MKMKKLFSLITGTLFLCIAQTETNAANSQRVGLYNRAKVEETGTSSDDKGLYTPLRASKGSTITGETPGIDEGIGTATPIGNLPILILLAASTAYIGFVFFRKRKSRPQSYAVAKIA